MLCRQSQQSGQQADPLAQQILQLRVGDISRYRACRLRNRPLATGPGNHRDQLLIASADESETIRRWAVDALARLGGVEVVDPLIDIGLADPSALVRERAFCGVAMSGTLLLAERYEALPRLLAIVESQTSELQTRSWAYQALREISSQYDLPEEPAAWRDRLTKLGLLLPAEALPR